MPASYTPMTTLHDYMKANQISSRGCGGCYLLDNTDFYAQKIFVGISVLSIQHFVFPEMGPLQLLSFSIDLQLSDLIYCLSSSAQTV